MHDLDFFFPDELTIESSSKRVRAQMMRSGEILIHGDDVPIVVDDVLTRTLKNGIVENYHVLDASYQKGHGRDLPATTKLRVQKQGAKAPRSAAQHITYNVTGANSRINVQSQDHSTNVVNVTAERLFADLKSAISGDSLDGTEKEKLLHSVDAMQAAQGTTGFAASFQHFMSLAANCMKIVTPFLPAITQLLSS